MEALAALADNLYRNFILRDIVGKVVPGLIIEVGVWSVIVGDSPVEVIGGVQGLHGAVLAALFALAWTLGFVAQTLLDLVKWVATIKSGQNKPNCVRVLQPGSDLWVEEVRSRTRLTDLERRELERLAVIKEATGNLSMALVVFVATGYLEVSLGRGRWWVGLALIALAVAGLLARHFDACRREVRLSDLFINPPH